MSKIDDTAPDERGCTDPTDPQYYLDRSAHSEAEADMRADYALAYRIRKDADQARSLDDIVKLTVRANAIARPWKSAPGVNGPWELLHDMVTRWEREPEKMRRGHDRLVTTGVGAAGLARMLPFDWRSNMQARELTGNGAWISMPSLDAARHTPDAPVPQFGSRRETRSPIERTR